MNNKKYKLTDETINVCGYILHRIKALIDFGNVKAGDLGGYIESEDNLSHDGNCWVYDDAKVYGNAVVGDNAMVYDNACVYSNAKVFGKAKVFDNAMIYNNALVFDNACI